jgi:hypothetical protein
MRMISLALIALATATAPAPPVLAAPAVTRNCLLSRDIRGQRLSADQGYFAQTRQGWWRNAAGACAAYGPRRALLTRTNSNQQCAGDFAEVFDAFSRIGYGGCRLGKWEKLAVAPDVPDK